MAARANTSEPCRNFASWTEPSRPINTCSTTLPRCPPALAASGYIGSVGCISRSQAADSGRFTGSIDDIAASTGLAPLASGVVEASCDLRLDGIATLAAGPGTPWGGVETSTGAATGRGCGCGCGTAAWATGGFDYARPPEGTPPGDPTTVTPPISPAPGAA